MLVRVFDRARVLLACNPRQRTLEAEKPHPSPVAMQIGLSSNPLGRVHP